MALQDKIRRIDDLKKQLDGLLPMPVEQQQKLDEKLRLEFHYNTNHIEGNTLTYGETKLAILFDQVSEGHSLREFEEMKASDVAYKMVQELARDNERPLTESFIKSLNERLLVREYYKEALTPDGQETRRLISIGDYKKHPNSVRLENGELFHYATPAETPAMMTDMVAWYREEEEKKEHPAILLAALLHYRFVRIHPFDEGNGRVSRLLMNYVLFKNGYPPVVIKSEDKLNYLRALNRADAGDETAFVEYIADQLIWSLELSVKAAKGEDIEEQQDWKKKLAVLDRELSVNEEIQIKKSEPVINKIISEIILPAFRTLMVETSAFDNLFLNKWTELHPHRTINTYIYVFTDDIFEKFSANQDKFKENICITNTYHQFKKNGINTFNIRGSILILFEELQYGVYVNTINDTDKYSILYRKFYHQSLTDEEIETVVSTYANNVLRLIEINISNTKST